MNSRIFTWICFALAVCCAVYGYYLDDLLFSPFLWKLSAIATSVFAFYAYFVPLTKSESDSSQTLNART